MAESTEAGATINETDRHHTAATTFTLTILGAGSATPVLSRHQTAQLLVSQHDYFLIDCGEGTQYRLIEQKIRPSRLTYIFISHLHGDHYFGLAPLLSSLNLAGRTDALYLFGPRGLDDVLTTTFRASGSFLNFPLHFQVTDPETPTLLLDLPHLTVQSFPLQHRIACTGFLFREKPHLPHLLREKLPVDVSVEVLKTLKKGHDVLDSAGNVLYAANEYTTPPAPARAYAYCSDTRYDEGLAAQLQGIDLLYHEATFLEAHAERAAEVYHSTAGQAAQLARLAGVDRLVLGHYSSRYKDLAPFLTEARAIFPATYLATEGQQMTI